jgi:acyl-CoA hydrolase
MLMHVEDKNLSGKIFGGLILRIGYELGWLCATKFIVNSLPTLSLVD